MQSTASERHGRAKAINTTTTLTWFSPRVISCYNASSINVTLPDPDDVPRHIGSMNGGPCFYYILRHAAGAVVIKDHTGTTLHTLSSSNTGVQVHFTGTRFLVTTVSINVAADAPHSAREALVEDEDIPEQPVSCFSGSDLCDLAVSEGLHPLDGEDGRELVIAPMFQDVTVHAKNAGREPIRAADLVMPSVIVVQFNEDEFTPDPLHPLAATVLSTNFYKALYNGGKPHALIYDAVDHGGASRHWHHVRWNGSTWGIGTVTAKRRVWVRDVEYIGDDGQTYNLHIRFVMEHTVDPEPELEPDGAGGANEYSLSMWGSGFRVFVFTDELDPDFEDGDSYTPAGAAGAVTFTRDDPCAWGATSGVGSDPADKYCHPQMVICASIPTTFEAPIGYEWVPPIDRERFSGVPGRNRELCYRWSNGAPWLSGSCTDPAPNGTGRMGNIVFGWTISSTSGAAMTLGGGFPKSKPMEWMVIENGQAVGRTYLVPTKPGWSESCGSLSLEEGSSIAIKICVEDQFGIEDGSGSMRWPGFAFNECDGHPDEPFEGVGGGHNCFNNNGTSTSCCIDLRRRASGVAVEKCVSSEVKRGDFNGTSCDVLSTKCRSSTLATTTKSLELEDYTYLMNGDQNNRQATWLALSRDPDQVLFDYTYDSGNVGDFVDTFGTWTKAATVEPSSASGTGTIKALLSYEPTGAVYRDWTDTFTIKKAMQAVHCYVARFSTSTDETSGYLFIVEWVSGTDGLLKIARIDSDVITVLESLPITLAVDEVECVVTLWGTSLTIECTIDGEDYALTAEDCTYADGLLGYGTLDASTDVEFELQTIVDQSYEYVEIESYLTRTAAALTFDHTAMNGYGKCEGTSGPDGCGTGSNCNCTTRAKTRIYVDTVTWSGPGDITLPDCENGIAGSDDYVTVAGGALPRCDCEGEFCGGLTWRCGQCPRPFIALTLKLPRGCVRSTASARMCAGLSYHYSTTEVCA